MKVCHLQINKTKRQTCPHINFQHFSTNYFPFGDNISTWKCQFNAFLSYSLLFAFWLTRILENIYRRIVKICVLGSSSVCFVYLKATNFHRGICQIWFQHRNRLSKENSRLKTRELSRIVIWTEMILLVKFPSLSYLTRKFLFKSLFSHLNLVFHHFTSSKKSNLSIWLREHLREVVSMNELIDFHRWKDQL